MSVAKAARQGSKVKAVNTWPTPKSLTELRAFLGAVGYYRRFIKDFSAVASPLFQLLKKDTSWEWTEERQQTFDDLKSRLVQEPILALPANASDFALGAVLSQVQHDEEKVIAYSSRTLSAAEKKYEVTRKELLGIVHGLKHFRQ